MCPALQLVVGLWESVGVPYLGTECDFIQRLHFLSADVVQRKAVGHGNNDMIRFGVCVLIVFVQATTCRLLISGADVCAGAQTLKDKQN